MRVRSSGAARVPCGRRCVPGPAPVCPPRAVRHKTSRTPVTHAEAGSTSEAPCSASGRWPSSSAPPRSCIHPSTTHAGGTTTTQASWGKTPFEAPPWSHALSPSARPAECTPTPQTSSRSRHEPPPASCRTRTAPRHSARANPGPTWAGVGDIAYRYACTTSTHHISARSNNLYLRERDRFPGVNDVLGSDN